MKNSNGHLHQLSPIFTGNQKMSKFCPDFRPHSHSKRSGFKGDLYIKNLKNAQNVPTVELKVAKRVPLSLLQFLQGVKKLILPNFTILGALVSEQGNKSKI